MPKQQSTDMYDFYPDHVIVHSKSGNTYFINSKLECNCVGYGYHQECRHTQFVKEQYNRQIPANFELTVSDDLPPISETQQSILDQLTKGHS